MSRSCHVNVRYWFTKLANDEEAFEYPNGPSSSIDWITRIDVCLLPHHRMMHQFESVNKPINVDVNRNLILNYLKKIIVLDISNLNNMILIKSLVIKVYCKCIMLLNINLIFINMKLFYNRFFNLFINIFWTFSTYTCCAPLNASHYEKCHVDSSLMRAHLTLPIMTYVMSIPPKWWCGSSFMVVRLEDKRWSREED